MENSINQEHQPELNPDKAKQDYVGAGTNAEKQEIVDSGNPEDEMDSGNDPSTWPSGDKSLEQLLDEDQSAKETRVGGSNITSGTGSGVENP